MFVADVFKVLLVDSKDNVLATDTLQNADIAKSVETTDVDGGGSTLAVLHGKSTIEISLTDPVWRMETLALHLGQDIKTGAGVAYAMPVWKTVKDNTGSLEIELENAPIDKTVKMYMDDGTPIAGYTVTDKKVVISDAVVEDGQKIEVRTYQYKTDVNTETLEIDITKFPKDVKMILETLEIGEDEQPMNRLQYIFDRVKPSANFEVNTSQAREASNTETTFRVLKPKESTVVGKLLRIPFATV